MGVAEQNRIRSAGPGIGQKTNEGLFYMMPMAVGHEDADTAQGLQPGLRIRDEAPVGIAVTGDLVKADLWVFFCQTSAPPFLAP